MGKSKSPQSIGIDVAKAKIDVAILWDTSNLKVKQFSNQTELGIQNLILWLKKHEIKKNIPIVIESTGSYHWLCCLMLSEEGYRVHLINPLITKKYQRSAIRGSKTDVIDAKRLGEIGIIEKNLPLFFDTRESLSTKKYHSLYAKIQKVKQQLTRSYKDAKESAEIIGISLNLETIKECLDQIKVTLEVLRGLIEENASEIAVEVSKVKGISKFQSSVICSAVEGRTFETRDQLIAFFGLDVRVKESGTWRGRSKLSKRGNSFYRLVLFQLGWSLARNNEKYAEYYQTMRDRDKHYYTCIIATARKFLRYFFVYYLKPNNHMI